MNQQPVTSLSVTIADSAAVSGAFCMDDFVAGIVIIPTSWTDANMGFKVCDTQAGTYVPLKGETGTPIQISSITTDASFAYRLPVELFACRWVKLWSKNTTAATVTDNNQTGAITLTLMLK